MTYRPAAGAQAFLVAHSLLDLEERGLRFFILDIAIRMEIGHCLERFFQEALFRKPSGWVISICLGKNFGELILTLGSPAERTT